MQFITALLIGSLVGWVSPLVGRGGLGPLADMFIGALGGLLGMALSLVIPANATLLTVFGAALALAVLSQYRVRIDSGKHASQ